MFGLGVSIIFAAIIVYAGLDNIVKAINKKK